MSNGIQSVTMKLGRVALDAYLAREQVLANNIANANTQSYQPLRLNFEEQLQGLRSAVAAGSSDHTLEALIDQIHPYVQPREVDALVGDSHERLDEEMTLLAQNTMQYEAVLTAMNRDNALTRVALTGEP